MPRQPRFVVPGVPHHVTQRGNNRQTVFFDDDDRRRYLRLLSYFARRNGAYILGYCLMTNHVHLIVTPESENSLARTFGGAHGEYAQAHNHSAERSGHLWQNRYFSCPLEGSHLARAMLYVDLNPVRVGLTADAAEWRWSSARAHSVAGAVDPVLVGNWRERVGGWDSAEWRELLTSGREADDAPLRQATRRGEPFGTAEFVVQMEREAGRRLRVLGRGRPRKGGEGGDPGRFVVGGG